MGIPPCSASREDRSSSSRLWEDGAWSTGRTGHGISRKGDVTYLPHFDIHLNIERRSIMNYVTNSRAIKAISASGLFAVLLFGALVQAAPRATAGCYFPTTWQSDAKTYNLNGATINYHSKLRGTVLGDYRCVHGETETHTPTDFDYVTVVGNFWVLTDNWSSGSDSCSGCDNAKWVGQAFNYYEPGNIFLPIRLTDTHTRCSGWSHSWK